MPRLPTRRLGRCRELELLPIQYFHLVFTLPEDLNRLAQYHDAEVYAILMRAAAETLQTFARKRWDADLGIVSVLHTWGQTLQLHPHVHCLVTGGALKRDGSAFVQAPKNFLFPGPRPLAGLPRHLPARTRSPARRRQAQPPARPNCRRRRLEAALMPPASPRLGRVCRAPFDAPSTSSATSGAT
jgi:hypothetical protein